MKTPLPDGGDHQATIRQHHRRHAARGTVGHTPRRLSLLDSRHTRMLLQYYIRRTAGDNVGKGNYFQWQVLPPHPRTGVLCRRLLDVMPAVMRHDPRKPNSGRRPSVGACPSCSLRSTPWPAPSTERPPPNRLRHRRARRPDASAPHRSLCKCGGTRVPEAAVADRRPPVRILAPPPKGSEGASRPPRRRRATAAISAGSSITCPPRERPGSLPH